MVRVPEQGLREALEQITAVFKPPAIQYAREEYWLNRAKRMAEIARAALERPRHALPEPDDQGEILAGAAIEAQRRGFEKLCFSCLEGFSGARCPRCPIGFPAEHAPPDPTDYGLLNRAIELLMANEREYAPSNAASDWYLRDQRVLALVREVTTRGSRSALAGSPSDYDWLLLEMNLARLTDELNRIPELRREDELQLAEVSLETVRRWRAVRVSGTQEGNL